MALNTQNKTPNDLDKLEDFLKNHFPECPLMPSSKDKCPMYKHAQKTSNFLWEKWAENKHKINHGVLLLLRDDIIVIDIDDQKYVDWFEEKFPSFKSTAVQKTKKGKHYFFKRTQKCDDMSLFDGARQFEYNGDVFPIDIKTKCSTGTGGCIAVYPSQNKTWINPLYDFTRDSLPDIPDTILDFFESIKKKSTNSHKYIYKRTGFVSDYNTPVKNNENGLYVMNEPIKPSLYSSELFKTYIDIGEIRQLVELLDAKRSENYSYWIEVMWCLQNILYHYNLIRKKTVKNDNNDSENEMYQNIEFADDADGFRKELFVVFDKFSRKCPTKYNMQKCLNLWCNHVRDGYKLGSLHHWAMEDNPEQYAILKIELAAKWISGCRPHHTYVASRFLNYVAGKFIYAGDKRWYYFNGNLWIEDTESICLIQHMNRLFRRDIEKVFVSKQKEMNNVQNKIDAVNSMIKENNKENGDRGLAALKEKEKGELIVQKISLKDVIDNCNVLIDKLGDVNFIRNTLTALATTYLYDKNFEKNLDSHSHLLAFTNGVWDFEINGFRQAEPCDIVSKSVGFPYNQNINVEVAKKVDDYWNTLHPIPEQKEYIIKTFARQLYGDKGANLFHLHAGYKASASNGKSTFFEILEASLGDYVHKFGVEYITSNRGEAGKPMPEFEHWKGTRIIYCSEPSQEDKINSGVLKEYSGGEKMSYRLLNKNTIHSFVPMFKIHLMCNNTPIIDGDDQGIQRRTRKIDYMSEFKESEYVDESKFIYKRDENLVRNFMKNDDFKMEFVRKLLDNFDYSFEFTMPQRIKISSQELIQDNDPVRAFIEEYVVQSEGSLLPFKEIKDGYKYSDFFTPKKNVDRHHVERLLKTECFPIKTLRGKTYRNVFEGFRLLKENNEDDDGIF